MSKAMARGALGVAAAASGGDPIDWELRPGGMLVQLRDPQEQAPAGPKIKLKISYNSSTHQISISPDASFGDLKKLLIQETGLHPKEQKLIFRGKEKESTEYLHVAGVKDKSKITVVEDFASREKRLLESRRNNAVARACKAIDDVRQEVDKLAGELSILEGIMLNGSKIADNDLEVLTEMLMCQLLKLDGIKGDGDAKIQRRVQVTRVQKYVETVDRLKARNAVRNKISSTLVTTNWERFDGGANSHATPTSTSESLIMDWEIFK